MWSSMGGRLGHVGNPSGCPSRRRHVHADPLLVHHAECSGLLEEWSPPFGGEGVWGRGRAQYAMACIDGLARQASLYGLAGIAWLQAYETRMKAILGD